MGVIDHLEEQLTHLIDDSKRLVSDMEYYEQRLTQVLPSSEYYKATVTRKAQQLVGLRLLIAETSDRQTIEIAKEMLATIKTELYVLSKRWQLELSAHLTRYSISIEKPRFSFS